jgi:hypothetical protein
MHPLGLGDAAIRATASTVVTSPSHTTSANRKADPTRKGRSTWMIS